MMRSILNRLLFMTIAVALVVLSGASPSTASDAHEYLLSNGMKVLLVEVPKAPVATVQVWYKVGSRNEVMGRAGLSHMLEHMMFKGTAKYPKGTFSRVVRKNGGVDNAFTSQDFTAYFENLAADRVELALEMEADRMQGLLLDNAEFQTEREVVKEERRLRTEDDPQGALVEALFAQAFFSHPYHWPVIGWFADLDAMSLDDLQRHYDTFYSPNNATLIVVGDIKAETLLPTIKRLFEPIPKGPTPKQALPPEPDQRGERRFLLKREAQVPFVMMGFRVPNYASDDSYALDVLESILSRGKSSRLYQSLVYDQKNSLAVGAEYSLMQTDPSLFYFYALVSPGQKVEAVEESLHREIARLQHEPPTDLELQRAKNQVEAAHVFEQDSNFRNAMLLGQAETVGAGWRRVDQFLERIRAVTAKDVQRVAKQYLTEDNRTVGILIPLPPKPAEALPTAATQGKS
ncbi:M16 family metallopeptidase [Nitrospira moscoviensis]|uniref:Putative Zn-dependent peptidase, M16 family n=1 Tax=Nitrospira moscoviensis TaxID=42253 RepID=A0A0K2GHZ8_NITMO|nr:pitrilysin family protein [Nitrospira moscoviensis]ALA60556.1 putative Zn-dependent peptidase, M16 family [Nitrospira moscoviensis]